MYELDVVIGVIIIMQNLDNNLTGHTHDCIKLSVLLGAIASGNVGPSTQMSN